MNGLTAVARLATVPQGAHAPLRLRPRLGSVSRRGYGVDRAPTDHRCAAGRTYSNDPDLVGTLLFGDLDDDEAEMPGPELDVDKAWHFSFS